MWLPICTHKYTNTNMSRVLKKQSNSIALEMRKRKWISNSGLNVELENKKNGFGTCSAPKQYRVVALNYSSSKVFWMVWICGRLLTGKNNFLPFKKHPWIWTIDCQVKRLWLGTTSCYSGLRIPKKYSTKERQWATIITNPENEFLCFAVLVTCSTFMCFQLIEAIPQTRCVSHRED